MTAVRSDVQGQHVSGTRDCAMGSSPEGKEEPLQMGRAARRAVRQPPGPRSAHSHGLQRREERREMGNCFEEITTLKFSDLMKKIIHILKSSTNPKHRKENLLRLLTVNSLKAGVKRMPWRQPEAGSRVIHRGRGAKVRWRQVSCRRQRR